MPSSSLDQLLRAVTDGPVEDAILAYRESRQALLEQESATGLETLNRAIRDRVWNYDAWQDPKRAAQALRFVVELLDGDGDADSTTYLLIRALAQDPDSDEALAEYVTAVANDAGRYHSFSVNLFAIATRLQPHQPERAARLAALETIAEYCVVGESYPDALRTCFASAAALGVDAVSWDAARAWVLAIAPFAEVPADLWTRFATTA